MRVVDNMGNVLSDIKRIFRGRIGLTPAGGIQLERRVLVGTHAKSGTVWMLNVFGQICGRFRLKMFVGEQEELPDDFHVFFQPHSQLRLEGLPADARGMHMIRDPRDVIVSACFYHQKSDEPWLHVKRQDFGGLTYQEKLNSYVSFDDQLLFTMEHSGSFIVQTMLAWDYSNPGFIEVRYEDLIEDHDLLLFHKVFSFLGFPGSAIPEALATAYRNSLFSGKVATSTHVRSGGSGQWKRHFQPIHKARFTELFGDAVTTLGYEASEDWSQAQ
jgi:hypothetical protein